MTPYKPTASTFQKRTLPTLCTLVLRLDIGVNRHQHLQYSERQSGGKCILIVKEKSVGGEKGFRTLEMSTSTFSHPKPSNAPTRPGRGSCSGFQVHNSRRRLSRIMSALHGALPLRHEGLWVFAVVITRPFGRGLIARKHTK